MAFKKPDKYAEGTRFLIWGDFATGKSPFALSFPKQGLVDSDSGTSWHNYNNVIAKTDTLVFKELNEDLDELENDDDLFNELLTFNVDSITRFAENQEHSALKVVEQRARKANRLIEGEGLSFKERGIIKLHYERFFARMLNYVKRGKNVVFVAEMKDKNETRIDGNGNQTFVKVGEMPNMQKGSEYDFDVVVYCFLDEEGKPKGKVIRDKTGTFNAGDIIDKPNYSHWKEAVEKRQAGKLRTKDELKSLDESLEKEMQEFENTSTLENLIEEVMKTAKSKKAKVPMDKINNALGNYKTNPKSIPDIETAEKILSALSKL